jgi:hypothetical protein
MLLSICPISSAIVLTLPFSRGRRDHVHMDLQLPMQLVPITTKVVSSNHAHGEVYSIQHHEIKFVNDLRQVGGFIRVLLFPPPILTVTIIKILLKMVLNTISLNPVFDKVHMIAASFKYSNLYNQLHLF